MQYPGRNIFTTRHPFLFERLLHILDFLRFSNHLFAILSAMIDLKIIKNPFTFIEWHLSTVKQNTRKTVPTLFHWDTLIIKFNEMYIEHVDKKKSISYFSSRKNLIYQSYFQVTEWGDPIKATFQSFWGWKTRELCFIPLIQGERDQRKRPILNIVLH